MNDPVGCGTGKAVKKAGMINGPMGETFMDRYVVIII